MLVNVRDSICHQGIFVFESICCIYLVVTLNKGNIVDQFETDWYSLQGRERDKMKEKKFPFFLFLMTGRDREGQNVIGGERKETLRVPSDGTTKSTAKTKNKKIMRVYLRVVGHLVPAFLYVFPGERSPYAGRT